MGTLRRVAVALALLGVLALGARADETPRYTIGLYAPSAPFDGPEARLGFVTELAEHMQARTGRVVVGRVFSRLSDVTAAAFAKPLN